MKLRIFHPLLLTLCKHTTDCSTPEETPCKRSGPQHNIFNLEPGRRRTAKVCIVFLAIASAFLFLASCTASRKISGDSADDSATPVASDSTSVVIVYYDTSVGSGPLEATIKRHHCEVLYRYQNFKAFALRISGHAVRHALEKTKGVLTVKDDQILHLD